MLCKVTKQEPEGFQPIKIEWTLQNVQELHLFRSFAAMNSVIPNAIAGQHPESRNGYGNTLKEVSDFARIFLDNTREGVNRCLAGKVI